MTERSTPDKSPPRDEEQDRAPETPPTEPPPVPVKEPPPSPDKQGPYVTLTRE